MLRVSPWKVTTTGMCASRPGDDREEERLEVVRVQQPHSLLEREARDRAGAAKVQARGAVEPHRGETAPARFLGQRVRRPGARDRAHDGQVRPGHRGGEREHRPVRAVERVSLPEVEDGNHDRAAISR